MHYHLPFHRASSYHQMVSSGGPQLSDILEWVLQACLQESTSRHAHQQRLRSAHLQGVASASMQAEQPAIDGYTL